jgi:hypothetical protein
MKFEITNKTNSNTKPMTVNVLSVDPPTSESIDTSNGAMTIRVVTDFDIEIDYAEIKEIIALRQFADTVRWTSAAHIDLEITTSSTPSPHVSLLYTAIALILLYRGILRRLRQMIKVFFSIIKLIHKIKHLTTILEVLCIICICIDLNPLTALLYVLFLLTHVVANIQRALHLPKQFFCLFRKRTSREEFPKGIKSTQTIALSLIIKNPNKGTKSKSSITSTSADTSTKPY